MVVVLPEPLTPATRMTKGLQAGSIASGMATGMRIFSISAARIALTSSALDGLVVAALAHGGGDAGGGADAEIGADQHVLQLFQHAGIELALGDEIGDRGGDGGRGAGEPAAQPPPPALAGFASSGTSPGSEMLSFMSAAVIPVSPCHLKSSRPKR